MSDRAPSEALSKVDYERVRRQLSFRPSPAWALLTLVVNAAMYVAILKLLAAGTTSGYWGAQLLLPIAMFQAFGVLHDCGHGSFSSNRQLNTLVGHYASVLCGLPYFPWKYIHTEHHVWAGNPERDPGLALVRRAKRGKVPWLVRAAWRSWVPLAGVAQHVVFWMYPIAELRRGKLSRSKLLRCTGSVAWLVVAYAGLHWLAPSLIAFRMLLPGLMLYVVLVELVNVPHHTGLTEFDEKVPLWEQHLPTRSCRYPKLISEFVVLNFNFHIEHHLFPNLPWYRLRAARDLVKPALGYLYRDAHAFRWAYRARKQSVTDVMVLAASDFVSVRPATVDPARKQVREQAEVPTQGRELPT